ncbi:MAG: KTSC domain-containing protein [Symbiopectobacterium sp.]|uniref:KTSC domain-containing protein n=1 Tax=Symbiopectobacterium sp. TaxID=2952789 RepID=UPI0039EBF749
MASSELFSVGYDEEKKHLEVELLNGSIYLYKGVARMIYEELLSSTTKYATTRATLRAHFPFDKLQ